MTGILIKVLSDIMNTKSRPLVVPRDNARQRQRWPWVGGVTASGCLLPRMAAALSGSLGGVPTTSPCVQPGGGVWEAEHRPGEAPSSRTATERAPPHRPRSSSEDFRLFLFFGDGSHTAVPEQREGPPFFRGRGGRGPFLPLVQVQRCLPPSSPARLRKRLGLPRVCREPT